MSSRTLSLTDREIAALSHEQRMQLQSRARAYQARADAVFAEWGFRAPQPALDCNPEDFRRDLCVMAKKQLPYSDDKPSPDSMATFADLRRMKLWGMSPEIFANFEPQIYDACTKAASRNDTVPKGQLRQVTVTDPRTGAKVTKFYGQQSFVLDPDYGHRPGRRVTSFRTDYGYVDGGGRPLR
jgi:hypothetical protein